MATKSARDKIVDTALALAEQRSWEAVRLHDVASELGMTLNEVRAHFREKEDLVDAWFDRADRAMLEDTAKPDFLDLAPRERLQRVIMTWLSALAPHRRPTRQMIYNKFEPGHVHYQFSGLLRVSRTVQWMREAAHRDATLPRRAFEETALTCIYLMTFFYWMRDDSEGANRTAAFLDQLLGRAESLAHVIPGCRKTPGKTAQSAHPSAGSKAAPPA